MRNQTLIRPSGFLVLLLSVVWTGNSVAQSFPEVVSLPDGFQPEGVTLGVGHQLFAGSLYDGSVYSVDLRTGAGGLVVPPQAVGQSAVGLSFDRRSGLLFVAGGLTGAAYVYDPSTGARLQTYQLTIDPTLINDVIVTRDAAYFTDSFQPAIYRLPLGPRGALPRPADVETIPLSGDFSFIPTQFNANGIEVSPDGQSLIIVHSTLGSLYRVEPETGFATEIDLGGQQVFGGDGLVMSGQSLFVVQNPLNQIAVVALAPDFGSGVVEAIIENPFFDTPSTAARFGSSLYVVNARFGTPPLPSTTYDVVKVRR